jgi:hypothetical protein
MTTTRYFLRSRLPKNPHLADRAFLLYLLKKPAQSAFRPRWWCRYFFGIVCCLALASARIIAAIAPRISSLRIVDMSLGLEINMVIVHLKKLAIVNIVKATTKKQPENQLLNRLTSKIIF